MSRHCGGRRRRERRKSDVEAIATPLAQSSNEDGRNARHHLFQEIEKSDIEVRERFHESGPGSQKVIKD